MVIDPMIFFSRLVVLMQRHDGITRFFAYEFAVVPMPCSKTMCKLSKSALAKALDQRKTKDASKPDASFSIESENELARIKKTILM